MASIGTARDVTRTEPPEEIQAVPVRHVGRWIAAGIVVAVVASLVDSVVTNPNFKWNVTGHYLFNNQVLHGVLVTIELTFAAMALGIVLGVALAVMRMSPNFLLRGVSGFYIWFIRGTPVLVQILAWYYISSVYQSIDLGVPFGPALVHLDSNTAITHFVAGMLGLGLNEGAYYAEIVRAGIISVDEGQHDAAHALGMTRLQTMRRIVLPQAMRVIIPPTGNETISMLKLTSLVAFIGLSDLLYSVQLIYSQNYLEIPLLITACIWYLVLTTVFSIGQIYLERYFGRGATREEAAPTLLQRIRAALSPRHAGVEALSGLPEEHR